MYPKIQIWLVVGFANPWQLEVSCLYLIYNALISTFRSVEELSYFDIDRAEIFEPVGAVRYVQINLLHLIAFWV